ncbi:unnamed protein product [Sphagnum jensenii]
MHALPPHLAYILLSISAHKSSDAKRSSYFPCSFLLLLRRRVSLLFVSSRLFSQLVTAVPPRPGRSHPASRDLKQLQRNDVEEIPRKKRNNDCPR